MAVARCQHHACDREARFAPVVCVPAQGWPRGLHKPARMIIGVEVCAQHLRDIKVEEMLSDDIRQVVRLALAGLCPPDFSRAWVDRIALDHPDYRKLADARSRGAPPPPGHGPWGPRAEGEGDT